MIIPANMAQVNLMFTGASIPTGAQVTFGVRADVVTDPTEIGEAVIAAIGSSGVLAPLSNTLDLSTVLVKIGPNDSGPSAEVPSETGGGTAGNVAPPNVAALVRKNTPIGGRHGSGRFYLPGIIETVVGDDGILSTSFVNGMNTDLNDFRVALDSADIEMMLLHSDATAPSAVTSLTMQARAATQRRRLRR